MRRRVVAALGVLACVGCGLDESGIVSVDDGGPIVDVTAPDVSKTDAAPLDGGAPDVMSDVTPVPDAGPCDDDANECTPPEVTAGWTPVAFVENQTTACAAPFSMQDDEFEFAPGTAACTCGCAKTADPDCTSGTIATAYSFSPDSKCDGTGTPLGFNKGACAAFPFAANIADYYASAAIPPTGGTCKAQTQASGNLASTAVRLCGADPSCKSAACGGYAPSGYKSCIVAGGDQSCPLGSSFANKISIGKSATPSCSDCGPGCQLNATCQSPQVHFFTDSQCNSNKELVALPSDGTCAPTNHGGATVGAVTYTATPSSNCQATGTTSLSLAITGQKTLCCR